MYNEDYHVSCYCNLPPPPPPPHSSPPDLYQSCEKGDLRGVQAQLHTMPDAINEFIQDGQNLLMW